EELLQVDVHDKVVPRRDVVLRPQHSLMRRAPRPKAEACLGERLVPLRLQHLHHRLLDEAVEHRRDAERPQAARRLRYLHPPHRLRLVGALKQLSPDREPVLLQVGRQVIDAHAVDSPCPLVALPSRQRFPQILTLDNCFHRRSGDRRAFETGSRRARFGLLSGGARGFTLRSGAQVQLDLILLPHGSRERGRSTGHFHRSSLRPRAAAYYPLLSLLPSAAFSPATGTQRSPPEVRPTAFAARPPDLPPRPLMTVDFAIICSLVRPGRPRYPVLVHRAAALLHASFRPRLAATPLRFANPSPPSGWIEDLHLRAIGHARHTNNRPPPRGAGRTRPRLGFQPLHIHRRNAH